MPNEFSRRDFMKYTAAAAVVVAGSSLLTGCGEGYTATQTEFGTTNTVAKVAATLKSAKYNQTAKTVTFELEIKNNRSKVGNQVLNFLFGDQYIPYDVVLTDESFRVTTSDGSYTTVGNNLLTVSTSDGNPNIKYDDKEAKKVTVTISGFDGISGDDTLLLTFWPNKGYVENYTANWRLTAKQLKSD